MNRVYNANNICMQNSLTTNLWLIVWLTGIDQHDKKMIHFFPSGQTVLKDKLNQTELNNRPCLNGNYKMVSFFFLTLEGKFI